MSLDTEISDFISNKIILDFLNITNESSLLCVLLREWKKCQNNSFTHSESEENMRISPLSVYINRF